MSKNLELSNDIFLFETISKDMRKSLNQDLLIKTYNIVHDDNLTDDLEGVIVRIEIISNIC